METPRKFIIAELSIRKMTKIKRRRSELMDEDEEEEDPSLRMKIKKKNEDPSLRMKKKNEDPSLRIESSAIINLRGLSTKLYFKLQNASAFRIYYNPTPARTWPLFKPKYLATGSPAWIRGN